MSRDYRDGLRPMVRLHSFVKSNSTCAATLLTLRWKAYDRALRRGDVEMPGLSGAAIGQVSRSVTDLAGAVRWYSQTLGLDHLFTSDRLAFFQCGGVRLMLTQMGENPDAKSILYFQVSDIDSEYHELGQRGVEFVNTPHMIH